ncbi:hypothetical protein H9N25_13660 [Pedobacter riviphilus]|uniref:Uncharacterized protein n=1 Tax=Pedobacter riviphilus TaxID=2766984 RepID=A0ABX6TDG5_9SPHI|nr:hypothetical protein [Pedobacter riviphilus]QNR83023.1 hypothetical protein H9N25_13660 [Pedobacter riviphilus]
MKNTKTIILLVLMILLSLFSGISINRNWGFIYQFEFIDFLQLREREFKDYLIWGIIIVSHVGIISLPFLVKTSYFKKVLLYFPLVYLLGYLLLEAGFFMLLIPFMIVWIVTIVYHRKTEKNLAS